MSWWIWLILGIALILVIFVALYFLKRETFEWVSEKIDDVCLAFRRERL